jgi:hypothetical protein
MKHLIVLNLNPRRIMILFGSLFSIFGFVLWLGIQTGVRAQKEREVEFNLANRSPNEAVQLVEQEENSAVFELNPEKVARNKPVLEPLKAEDYGGVSNPEIPLRADPMNSSRPVTNDFANTSQYYTIQIAAFSKQADALRLVRELGNKKISAFIDRGVRYWYVRSGKGATKSDLQALAGKIRNSDYEALIIQQGN